MNERLNSYGGIWFYQSVTDLTSFRVHDIMVHDSELRRALGSNKNAKSSNLGLNKSIVYPGFGSNESTLFCTILHLKSLVGTAFIYGIRVLRYFEWVGDDLRCTRMTLVPKALEIVCGLIPHRGFESLSLRHQ